MTLKPCWSCHAAGPCRPHCYCAKCLDPVGYARWRRLFPQEYAAWLHTQREA